MSAQDIRVGQVWQDRDSRSPNRVCVIYIHDGRVQIYRGKRVWVRADRFVKRFRFLEEAPGFEAALSNTENGKSGASAGEE